MSPLLAHPDALDPSRLLLIYDGHLADDVILERGRSLRPNPLQEIRDPLSRGLHMHQSRQLQSLRTCHEFVHAAPTHREVIWKCVRDPAPRCGSVFASEFSLASFFDRRTQQSPRDPQRDVLQCEAQSSKEEREHHLIRN